LTEQGGVHRGPPTPKKQREQKKKRHKELRETRDQQPRGQWVERGENGNEKLQTQEGRSNRIITGGVFEVLPGEQN